MTLCSTFSNFNIHILKNNKGSFSRRFQLSQKLDDDNFIDKIKRRELILESGELATIGAIFNFRGKKPDYLGVQKNQPALALCPATKNCISTSENIESTILPENFTPRIVERTEDYLRLEYQSVYKPQILTSMSPISLYAEKMNSNFLLLD
ncbi:hypothetical protein GmHk_09G027202 [Glycine max]|nr:hypothetical protein GmHk_09G027202 [Glycine max]